MVINTSNAYNHGDEAHTNQVISREIIIISLKRKANDDFNILSNELMS